MRLLFLIVNHTQLNYLENIVKLLTNEHNYTLYVFLNCIGFEKYIKLKYDIVINTLYYDDYTDFNFKLFIDNIQSYENYNYIKIHDNALKSYSMNYYDFINSLNEIVNYKNYRDITKLYDYKSFKQSQNTITCNLMGGLGNLLFIIFATQSYALDFNCNVKWIINDVNNNDSKRKLMCEYELFKNFEYSSNLIDDKFINYNEEAYNYSELINKNENIRLNGFYQSYKYFYKNKDTIIKMLNFENYKLDIIEKYNSILSNYIFTTSIHIRRTDYVNLSEYHHNQNLIYYEKAMSYFNDSVLFLLFSDDIEWCKLQPIFIKKNIIFIDETNDEKSLYLMSLCNNNICANSSFSLWSAYLNNNNGITIIPYKWFGIKGPTYNIYDIMPFDKSVIVLNDSYDITNEIIQISQKQNLLFINPLKISTITKYLTVGIMLICTGKYIGYVKKTIQKINKYFLTNYRKIYYIITDNIEYFDDIKNKYNIQFTHIFKKGFPGDTLYRYHYFLMVKEHLLLNTNNMFYFDVDMDLCDYVNESILPTIYNPLIGVRHPGFIMQHPFQNEYGSPETNDKSTAFIPENKRIKNYIAGGFNGGLTSAFINMSQLIVKNIETDNINNVVAIWHDESHLNNYYTFNEKLFKILSPSYCYPEDLQSNFEPKIIALNKKHCEVRFSDIYITCEEISDFWINLFNIITLLSVAYDNKLTPVFKLSSRNKLYYNLQYNQHFDFSYKNIDNLDDLQNNLNINIKLTGLYNDVNFFIHNKKILCNYLLKNNYEDVVNLYNSITKNNNINNITCIHLGENNEYYEKILKYTDKNHLYVIIKNNCSTTYNFISNLKKKILIDEKEEYINLILSSMFKNIIISNSFFSFWTCFLNENLNVYVSKKINLIFFFEKLKLKNIKIY